MQVRTEERLLRNIYAKWTRHLNTLMILIFSRQMTITINRQLTGAINR